MKTIGIGVIGMGWMGDAHARAYRAIPDRYADAPFRPRLVVCADADPDRAASARERFGFERATTDWHAVVDDPDVEVVDVTTPNGLHLELNRAVAAAGKHLACEKPVGRFPEETLSSWEAVRDRDLRTFVGYNYRWAPLVQYAKQLIADGELGELTHYHGRFLNGYAGDPATILSWRFRAEEGLGTLGDLGSHVIDMALFLAGPIQRVTSSRATIIPERPLPSGAGTHYNRASGDAVTGPVTNEDYTSALVRFANGAQGILEACRIINGARCDMGFEVHGKRGALKWTFEHMNRLLVQRRRTDRPADDGFTELLSGPAHPEHRRFNPGWGVALGYDDTKSIEAYRFLRSVATGRQDAPGFRDAAAVAVVQQAMIRSWESESWETVGPVP